MPDDTTEGEAEQRREVLVHHDQSPICLIYFYSHAQVWTKASGTELLVAQKTFTVGEDKQWRTGNWGRHLGAQLFVFRHVTSGVTSGVNSGVTSWRDLLQTLTCLSGTVGKFLNQRCVPMTEYLDNEVG